MLWTGLLAIGAVLLVLSGGAKIFDPEPTRGALRASGLPSGRGVVIGLAVTEIVGGAAALMLPRSGPAVAAALYLGFAGFVSAALVRDLPLQSCGCFGRADTPPDHIHLIANLVFAGAAIVATVNGATPADLAGESAVTNALLVLFVCIGVWVTYLLLTALPHALALSRRAR